MKSLSSPITTQAAASQTGFAEILDFYLKESITTPYGATNVIRITNKPGGLSFFTPLFSPEPLATQGDAATYTEWPVKRSVAKASAKFMSDRMTINVSNVTEEWSDMLDDVEWQDTPVVIRKVSHLITVPTENDCATIFTGKIDSVRVDLKTLQFTCSNDFATFNTRRPAEDMHIGCRFRFGDDMCGKSRFHPDNLKPKTVAASSTTTRLLATYAGYSAQAVTADSGTDKVTLAAHTLSNGNRVRFGGTTVPGGLTAGRWYYVVSTATNDFKVSLTYGGSAIDLTTNGTSVTITSETGFTEDTGAKAYIGQAVTPDHTAETLGLTAHGLLDGDRVRFAATVMPSGLTAGVWYYVMTAAANDFQVSLTEGGGQVPFTSNGTAVTIDSSAPYGTDEVDALADVDIDASSEQAGNEGYRLRTTNSVGGTLGWRFASDPINPAPTSGYIAPHVDFDLGGVGYDLKGWKFTPDMSASDWAAPKQVVISWSDDAANYLVALTAVLQHTYVLSPLYRTLTVTAGAHRYWRVQIKKVDGSPFLAGVIGKIRAYDNFSATGTDRIDALSDAIPSTVCVGSDEVSGHEAVYVQNNVSGTWEVNVDGVLIEDIGRYDWGNNVQGYWETPEDQAGLANPLLKPFVTFDMGSDVALKLWRIKGLPGVERSDLVRIVQLYSATAAQGSGFAGSAYTHHLNFELPPTPGTWSDLLVHAATAGRYWRICVRSTWAEQLAFKMFAEVRAYLLGRNYWAAGRVTFASDTSTALLRNVSRAVTSSASGAVDVATLPATPVAGDRFIIERGCNRSLNACMVHRNETNFGGFAELPKETVVRA